MLSSVLAAGPWQALNPPPGAGMVRGWWGQPSCCLWWPPAQWPAGRSEAISCVWVGSSRRGPQQILPLLWLASRWVCSFQNEGVLSPKLTSEQALNRSACSRWAAGSVPPRDPKQPHAQYRHVQILLADSKNPSPGYRSQQGQINPSSTRAPFSCVCSQESTGRD